MTAVQLRQKSFDSVSNEIQKVQALMDLEAAKGELKLVIEKISDAARVYFINNGFKYKICLEPHKEVGTSTMIVLSWE